MKVDTNDDSFDSLNPPFAPNVWFDYGFRWYAIDKSGNIGIFLAAELPIPSKIFTNEAAYREIDSFFCDLPQITTAQLANGKIREIKNGMGEPLSHSDCLIEAGKGLHCIDEVHSYIETKRPFWGTEKEYLEGYYLKAIPNEKLNILDLPERLQFFLESYRLPIVFSEIEKIDVTWYLSCD